MNYFNKYQTIVLSLWLFNVPGFIVGATVVGLFWWAL